MQHNPTYQHVLLLPLLSVLGSTTIFILLKSMYYVECLLYNWAQDITHILKPGLHAVSN